MAGPLIADTGGTPEDILRAIQLDQKFHELEMGLG